MKALSLVAGRIAGVLEPVARQLVMRDLTIRIDVDPINVRVRVLDSARRERR
ncbi:hypothetical protein [Gordonia sp. SND2]|uniref:hypothetical protein n=1 Tax=Gordonia sp. SND2 TaxID=3388659 RepID=UPI00398A9960